MRRQAVAVGAAVLAIIVIAALSLFALARGPGADTADGRVVSISTAATGKTVCVRDDESGQTRCGEVALVDLPERLDSVEVESCAYIKVARGAALELERRECR